MRDIAPSKQRKWGEKVMRLSWRFGMGRLLLLILLVTAILSAQSIGMSSVSAQDEIVEVAALSPGTSAFVADGPLNQRASAGTNGALVQVLATGATVAIINGPTFANGYSWYYIDANGIEGYVAGEFLGTSGGFLVGDNVYINSNNVNVRSGPGISFSVIDQANYGVIGSVIGGPSNSTEFTWYKLQYNGSSIGWVAGDFLSFSSVPPPSNTFTIYSWIFATGGSVNLRFGPGTEYSIARTVQLNEGVIVSDVPIRTDGYTWYPVTTIDGFGGFVAGEFFTGGIFLDSPAYVADGPLNLRSIQTGTGSVLAVIPDGAPVYVGDVAPHFSTGQTWFQVIYDGISGWAAGSYLGAA